jgi:PPK2 family polyphosphate:nucleotide phosphotransferase
MRVVAHALEPAVMAQLRVEPGKPAGLHERDPAALHAPHFAEMVGPAGKPVAEERLAEWAAELSRVQELLWASDTYALLVVFQALDTAGKDGTIKHVLSGVNPQGCDVRSFKQPSAEELDHDFLWRAARAVPERGRIGIFNRSYYEEVLVVRVHAELLDQQRLPPDTPHGPKLWAQRCEDINSFEQHLDRTGTKLVKFFLHVSKAEQRRRLLDRLQDPDKRWKFSPADVAERSRWDDYQTAYEHALTATSTGWAPWYVIPADHKPVMRALVAGVLVHVIESLDLRPPPIDDARRAALDEAEAALRSEP